MAHLFGTLAVTYLDHISASVLQGLSLVPASPATHPHVDWPRYDRMTRLLEAQGFRYLMDVEMVENPQPPSALVTMPLRFMVDASGTVRAAFTVAVGRRSLVGLIAYLLHAWRPMLFLSTSLRDGRSVLTRSEAISPRHLVDPPWHDEERVRGPLDVAALLRRHKERVARLAPPAVAERIATPQATAATFLEGAMRWRENRRSVGWATRDELRRMSRYDGDMLDQLETEFRRLVAERGL